MKKLLTILLALAISLTAMFVFVACSNNESSDGDNENGEPPTNEPTIQYQLTNNDTAYEITSITFPDGLIDLVIPGTYNSKSVIKVSNFNIKNPDIVKSITFEEGIEHIGNGSISRNTAKELKIVFPSTLKETKFYFNGNNDTDVKNNVYIKDLSAWCSIKFSSAKANPLNTDKGNLYLNNSLTTELKIPEGVTSIAKYAFIGCDSITSVKVPTSLLSIGDRAFEECSNLKGKELDNGYYFESYQGDDTVNKYSVLYKAHENLVNANLDLSSCNFILDSAVSGCTKITSVELGDNLKSIGANAFSGCSNLKTITTGKNINYIGEAAFFECKKLESFTVPSGVSTINNSLFYKCEKLEVVYFHSGITYISAQIFDYSGLKNLYFDGTIEQWNAIEKVNGWCKNGLYNAYLIYNGGVESLNNN